MAEEKTLRVLVVEDEPLGAARLSDLLAEQQSVELLEVAEDFDDAVSAIRDQKPDLVFLDIQIPTGNGLDVVREVGPDQMPATIFVTAYDEYATEAFRVAAIDYLLKPFSDQRFEQAFRRAKRQIELMDLEAMRDKLSSLVGAEGAAPSPGPSFLDRIAVQSRGQMRVIPVEEIDFIAASGVYAELHVGDEKHLMRESLQVLEEELSPHDFFRIHRSTIVRVDRIKLLRRGEGGSYAVELKDGRRLRVGRARRVELEARLGRL